MIHFVGKSSINNGIILRYKLPINPDESESNFRGDTTINMCSPTHWRICFCLALPWNITAFYIMEISEKNQAYLGLIFLSPHLAYIHILLDILEWAQLLGQLFPDWSHIWMHEEILLEWQWLNLCWQLTWVFWKLNNALRLLWDDPPNDSLVTS